MPDSAEEEECNQWAQMCRQEFQQSAELLISDEATTGWWFFLQPDDGNVLDLPIFKSDLQHTAQASQRPIDYSIASALGSPLLHEIPRCIYGDVSDSRSGIVLAVAEEVV